MVIKNYIVQFELGNISPELLSIDLELAIIPAEHQMKFFMTTSNIWLPKETPSMLSQGIGIKFIYPAKSRSRPLMVVTSFHAHY